MAKKTGICMNLDCDNYKKEIEVEPGGEFECPLCHQPLKEGKGRKESGGNAKLNKNKVILIAGLVVIAIAAGIFLWMNNKAPHPTPIVSQPQEVDSVKADPLKVVPVEVDTTVAAASPEEIDKPKKEPKEQESTTHKIQNGKGTADLGYGIYTGDLKNGKPHGYGTITYKTSHKIVPSKDFIAKPGDTFEGDFRDGKISGLGYWKHDGNETAVKP